MGILLKTVYCHIICDSKHVHQIGLVKYIVQISYNFANFYLPDLSVFERVKLKSSTIIPFNYLSVQFSSVQSLSHVRLCDPTDCSTPGLLVHHQLPELTQTHVHRVGDAIQPSHPPLSPFPPAFSLSQHQGLFQCQFFVSDGQSIGVSASALSFQ